ncbi:MAG TPA: enolase C-terminal domain-like protein [Trueperaceae bacterium]
METVSARLLPSRLTHGLTLKHIRLEGERLLPVVRITNGESEGYGEAPPLPTFTGEEAEDTLAEVEAYLPRLVGVDPREALRRLHSADNSSGDLAPEADPANDRLKGTLRASLPARCAIDLALHDLIARSQSVPLHSILGGSNRASVTITRAIGFHPLDRTVELARRYLSTGVTALKLKVGRETATDAAVVRAVRKEVGPEVELAVDANESLDTASAIELVEACREARLAYFEQPVGRDDYAGLRAVRETGVKVLADESLFTVEDARRLHEAGAVDLLAIKLIKCGGLAPALEIARFAVKHDLPVIVIDPLGSALSLNPGLHLAAVLPDRGYAHGLSAGLDVDAPHAPHLPLIGGRLQLPVGPGNGARVVWPGPNGGGLGRDGETSPQATTLKQVNDERSNR